MMEEKEVQTLDIKNGNAGAVAKIENKKEEKSIDEDTDSDSELVAKTGGETTGEKFERKKSSLGPVETFFTVFKGLVAMGILFLPKGFAHAGWAFSMIAFLLCAFFTLEGLTQLVRAHDVAGGSYPSLARKSMGTAGKIALEIAVFLTQVKFSNIS